MNFIYDGWNRNTTLFINAWKNDFSVFEKLDASDVTVSDNCGRDDLDCNFDFTIYGGTCAVRINYVSGCALWFLTAIILGHRPQQMETIITKCPIKNDTDTMKYIADFLSKLDY